MAFFKKATKAPPVRNALMFILTERGMPERERMFEVIVATLSEATKPFGGTGDFGKADTGQGSQTWTFATNDGHGLRMSYGRGWGAPDYVTVAFDRNNLPTEDQMGTFFHTLEFGSYEQMAGLAANRIGDPFSLG